MVLTWLSFDTDAGPISHDFVFTINLDERDGVHEGGYHGCETTRTDRVVIVD